MEDDVLFESEVASQAAVAARRARQLRWQQRWRRTRTRGKLSFTISHGILIYGLPFATFMTLAAVSGLLGNHRPQKAYLIVFTFVWFAVTYGIAMDLWAWRQNERRLKALDDAERDV
jgi:hypothetical protein